MFTIPGPGAELAAEQERSGLGKSEDGAQGVGGHMSEEKEAGYNSRPTFPLNTVEVRAQS